MAIHTETHDLGLRDRPTQYLAKRGTENMTRYTAWLIIIMNGRRWLCLLNQYQPLQRDQSYGRRVCKYQSSQPLQLH